MDGTEKTMDELIAERRVLTDELSRCSPGSFPGTKAYNREADAIAALAAFDRANPAVLPEIRNRKRQPLTDAQRWG